MVVSTARNLPSAQASPPSHACLRWGASDMMVLLLDLVSPSDDPEVEQRVASALDQGVDWDELVSLAYFHRLAPLLYQSTHERWAERVPQETHDRLSLFFRENVMRNLGFVSQMTRTIALLDQAEIPVIPYKGAMLAQRLYGNPAMRVFGDIDLLIHVEDVPRALRLLVGAGYTAVDGLETYLDADYIRNKREARILAPETDIMIEIQWRVAAHWEIRQASDGMAEMWARCERTKMAGRSLRTFCPEDLMVVLSAHGSCHCWQWPSSVGDIADLIRSTPTMDWDQVMDMAGRLHIRRMILLAVYLVDAMLSQPVPEPLRQAVARDRATLERLAETTVRGHAGNPALSDSLWLEANMHIALRERLSDKLVYLRHYLAAYVRGRLRRPGDQETDG